MNMSVFVHFFYNTIYFDIVNSCFKIIYKYIKSHISGG